MTNPFEEKRKNERINSLVKERDNLKRQLSEALYELSGLRLQKSVWESIAKTNKKLEEENQTLFSNGYNQAVWDVTHFLTDKQKEVNND